MKKSQKEIDKEFLRPKELPKFNHKTRHQQLHEALDELIKDYVRNVPCGKMTVTALHNWSLEQAEGGKG